MSDGEVYSCQFLLHSTSGCFGFEEAHRGARAPSHIQISPDALRSYGFHHNSGMLNLYSHISSALRLLYTRIGESLQTCQPESLLPDSSHLDAKIGQISENVPLSSYHSQSRWCVHCLCAAIQR